MTYEDDSIFVVNMEILELFADSMNDEYLGIYDNEVNNTDIIMSWYPENCMKLAGLRPPSTTVDDPRRLSPFPEQLQVDDPRRQLSTTPVNNCRRPSLPIVDGGRRQIVVGAQGGTSSTYTIFSKSYLFQGFILT